MVPRFGAAHLRSEFRGSEEPVRWSWWAIAAGAALIAASQWLHAPSVEDLVASIIATVAALGTSFLVRGGPRWWATAASLALAIAAVRGGVAQQQLTRVDTHWEDWRRDASAHSLDVLRNGIDDAVRSAKHAADP